MISTGTVYGSVSCTQMMAGSRQMATPEEKVHHKHT